MPHPPRPMVNHYHHDQVIPCTAKGRCGKVWDEILNIIHGCKIVMLKNWYSSGTHLLEELSCGATPILSLFPCKGYTDWPGETECFVTDCIHGRLK